MDFPQHPDSQTISLDTCLRITTWPSVSCSQFASLSYPLENKMIFNRNLLYLYLLVTQEVAVIFIRDLTSWGHGLSPPWNSISNRHGDPMLRSWMMYLVWNGSYGKQIHIGEWGGLNMCFSVCLCALYTFKTYNNILYHCIHRPLGLSSLHKVRSQSCLGAQKWIEIHWFWSKFLK